MTEELIVGVLIFSYLVVWSFGFLTGYYKGLKDNK